MLSKYLRLHATQAPPPAGVELQPLPVPLSAREQEVLELIARGFSYAETARLGGVSVHTVRSHIKSLYAKLAVHSKNEAVFEAVKLGLLPDYARRRPD